MPIDTTEHGCPHLRETRQVQPTPIRTVSSPSEGCPFGRDQAASEPQRHVASGGGAGGWWAFASEARALGAIA